VSLPAVYDGTERSSVRVTGSFQEGASCSPAAQPVLDVAWREVPTGTVEISARSTWKWLAGLAVVAFALAGLIAIWAVVTVP